MMSDEIEGTSNEIKEMSVDVDAILNSLRTKIDEYLRGSQESRATSYTIHGVPQEMRVREDYVRCFCPMVVCIGPVQRNQVELGQLIRADAAFSNKWECLLKLFRANEESVKKIIKDFSSFMVTEARKSYEEQLVENLSNETLGQIMVLDGFFIIETLFNWTLYFYPGFEQQRRDFLLLDSQIPFPVLQCLYDSTRTVYSRDLKVVARDYVIWPRAVASCGTIPDRVHHLLHLFHSSLLPPSPNCGQPWHSLYSPRKPLQSATQLLEAGVKFRKTKDDDERSMIDVRFRRGYIEIPRQPLQSSTASELLNLLAFEKFHPECGNHVTIYMAFMNSLIDTAKDVNLLVSSGVLENKLGSDEDVAHFFNTACDDKGVFMKFEKDGHYLTGLFKDLEAYCAKPRHRYRAKLERDYLSSPWSVISLIAGTVLLILTVVQTFMAVYSYFIPPKSRG